MKKFLSIALAASIAAGSMLTFTGCKKDNVKGDGTASELSYWTAIDANLATRVQNMSEVGMYKQREKDSGVHINFIHPALGQEAEKFNLLMASEDLPDIIEYDWSRYPGGPQKAIDDGVIISLNDYMEYAPNYKKALETGDYAENYSRDVTTDNGDIFGFAPLNVGSYRCFGGIAIRRDLLKKTNLEMPETIDEWTNVLKAFKDMGIKTPLTGNMTNILGNLDMFVGAYGIGPRWYVDDDEVKYGPVQPEYKEYLATLHKWYEEGLIDKDLPTNNQKMLDAKVVNGESAAFSGAYLGSGLGRYLAQKKTSDPAFDLIGAEYPVLKKGDVNEFAIIEGDVQNTNTLAISTSCKDPIAAVKWIDYFYSEEGYNLVNFGIEGESYNMVDGKPVYTDTILKNPDGLSINEALLLYCRATGPCAGFKQAPEYLNQYYEFDQQKDTLERWVKNVEPSKSHTLSKSLSPTSDEQDVLNQYDGERETYVGENLWKFVKGEKSLDDYDEFVNTIKNNFHLDETQKVQQAMYDRYIDRK